MGTAATDWGGRACLGEERDREPGWQRNQGCVWLRAASVLSWEPGAGESEFCLDYVGI